MISKLIIQYRTNINMTADANIYTTMSNSQIFKQSNVSIYLPEIVVISNTYDINDLTNIEALSNYIFRLLKSSGNNQLLRSNIPQREAIIKQNVNKLMPQFFKRGNKFSVLSTTKTRSATYISSFRVDDINVEFDSIINNSLTDEQRLMEIKTKNDNGIKLTSEEQKIFDKATTKKHTSTTTVKVFINLSLEKPSASTYLTEMCEKNKNELEINLNKVKTQLSGIMPFLAPQYANLNENPEYNKLIMMMNQINTRITSINQNNIRITKNLDQYITQIERTIKKLYNYNELPEANKDSEPIIKILESLKKYPIINKLYERIKADWNAMSTQNAPRIFSSDVYFVKRMVPVASYSASGYRTYKQREEEVSKPSAQVIEDVTKARTIIHKQTNDPQSMTLNEKSDYSKIRAEIIKFRTDIYKFYNTIPEFENFITQHTHDIEMLENQQKKLEDQLKKFKL